MRNSDHSLIDGRLAMLAGQLEALQIVFGPARLGFYNRSQGFYRERIPASVALRSRAAHSDGGSADETLSAERN